MKEIKDITYDESNRLKLDIYLPETDHFDVFIYFHGGGLEGGSKIDAINFARDLTSENIAVVSADYRMYPDAHFPDFIVDAANAVAWVTGNIRRYGNCKRIFAGGSSAGGYLSMMLCFDKRYLNNAGVDRYQIDGYIHDAGQPTVHYNVLRERGLDTRRVLIDERAPIYFVGLEPDYPPMEFIISDNDMQNRLEQTVLMVSTLRHFGYDMSKIKYKLMNSAHCAYVSSFDEDGANIFGKLVIEFIKDKNI